MQSKKVSTDKYGPSGHRHRLRQRFDNSGRSALADYELLELLLTYVMPRIDTKPLAKALLHQFGSLLAIVQQPRERLVKVDGVGVKSALFIKLIHAFLTRCMETAVEDHSSISGPEDIFAYMRLHLGALLHECLYALYLDNANRVIHHTEVSAGTTDRTPIYPREVFKPALTFNATGLILVHNHPDGLPAPSEQDLELTDKIEDLANELDVHLIDHLIVTRVQAYSIKTGRLL